MQDKARALYALTLQHFPQGIADSSFLPTSVAGQPLELRCFTRTHRDAIEFAFFRAGRRYARTTLVVQQSGQIDFDKQGSIPKFDQDPLDATLNISLEEALNAAEQAIKAANAAG